MSAATLNDARKRSDNEERRLSEVQAMRAQVMGTGGVEPGQPGRTRTRSIAKESLLNRADRREAMQSADA